jgi:thiosulfate/3-mercaptopyruvate sulfurtransferase
MLHALLFAAAVGHVHPEQLVSAAWVATHAKDATVRVLDVRREGFDCGHIPESVWLDPESIRDGSDAPSFMLGPAEFERVMGRLGISDRTRVVIYDGRGGLLAARLWWMLNAYGHSSVALVNGGWLRWTAEHRRVATAVGAPGALHSDLAAGVASHARRRQGGHG